VQITPDELRTMLRRRGFDPALSFAAFDGCIMGFTLNGTGTFGGVPTAYDTGTGTLPEYRGRGLATQIFETSLPHLRAAGGRAVSVGGFAVQHGGGVGISAAGI
jgi:ribosomal protein S18 acetylase RimI-like enzyme